MGEEREKENIDWLLPECAQPLDPTQNLCMCPDQESNPRPAGAPDNTPTKPPGQGHATFLNSSPSTNNQSYLNIRLYSLCLIFHLQLNLTSTALSFLPQHSKETAFVRFRLKHNRVNTRRNLSPKTSLNQYPVTSLSLPSPTCCPRTMKGINSRRDRSKSGPWKAGERAEPKVAEGRRLKLKLRREEPAKSLQRGD